MLPATLALICRFTLFLIGLGTFFESFFNVTPPSDEVTVPAKETFDVRNHHSRRTAFPSEVNDFVPNDDVLLAVVFRSRQLKSARFG